MSQSLPNQVNDFNKLYAVEANGFVRHLSQSLPNQVNDFNMVKGAVEGAAGFLVAIPSKPGQRLQ